MNRHIDGTEVVPSTDRHLISDKGGVSNIKGKEGLLGKGYGQN